jgi:LAS superfamily LD-carboxypeptidase LdcB
VAAAVKGEAARLASADLAQQRGAASCSRAARSVTRTDVRLAAGRRPDAVEVEARATAELVPDDDLSLSDHADGGGYHGPLAYRQGKPMRPDVALAFDRMAAAARREAGLYLSITSGYRSDAEQAKLFAAKPTLHLFCAL